MLASFLISWGGTGGGKTRRAGAKIGWCSGIFFLESSDAASPFGGSGELFLASISRSGQGMTSSSVEELLTLRVTTPDLFAKGLYGYDAH